MSVLPSDVLRAVFQILYDRLLDDSQADTEVERDEEWPGRSYPPLQFSYVNRVHREFAKLR